jgi:hypothetical protein
MNQSLFQQIGVVVSISASALTVSAPQSLSLGNASAFCNYISIFFAVAALALTDQSMDNVVSCLLLIALVFTLCGSICLTIATQVLPYVVIVIACGAGMITVVGFRLLVASR